MPMKTDPPPSAEPRRLHPFFWLFLAWPAVVFLGYLPQIDKSFPFIGVVFDAGHFPDRPWDQRMPILAESLWILLISLLIAGVTLHLGRSLREWLGLKPEDGWVRGVFNLGLGILALDAFWLGTGLNGLWFKPVWMAAGAIVSILVVHKWVRERFSQKPFRTKLSLKTKSNVTPHPNPFPQGARGMRNLFEFFSFSLEGRGQGEGEFRILKASQRKDTLVLSARDWPYLLLLACGGFYFLFALGNGLVPETFYDSLMYHLAVPADWLSFHGIRDLSSNLYANFPYGAEFYYLNGLALQGTESAKMLQVLSYGAVALLVGGWAREWAGPKAGFLALGMTLTFPLLNLNAWTTQVEGPLTLFILLFFYCLSRLLAPLRPATPWALGAGLFAGAAFSVKYSAVVGIAAGFLALAVLNYLPAKAPAFPKGAKGGPGRNPWVWLTAAFLLTAGPWLLKNLVVTGNPFFPYFPWLFSGRHLPAEGYQRLLASQQDMPVDGFLSWFTLPWRLVMVAPDDHNFVGPAALALAPLLLFFRFKDSRLKFLAWACAVYFILGLGTTRLFRFVMPAFPLLYILLGTVFGNARREIWGKAAAALSAATAVLCFFNLAALNSSYYLCAGVWTGRESREAFMDRDKIAPYYPMARWVAGELPAGARLGVVGDCRGLYYNRPFVSQSFYDEPWLVKAVRGSKDAKELGRKIRELGLDYICVNAEEGVRAANDGFSCDLTPDQWKNLDDYFRRGLEPVYRQGLQAVYRVRKDPAEWMENTLEPPVLFLSAPAARFAQDYRNQRWEEARADLKEALKLYGFSPFWRARVAEVERRLAPNRFRGASTHLLK